MTPIIKPTVGRIVLYKSKLMSGENAAEDIFQPAIVTEVISDTVISVCVFLVNGTAFVQSVEQGQECGQWDWMPFQKDQQARLVPPAFGDPTA